LRTDVLFIRAQSTIRADGFSSAQLHNLARWKFPKQAKLFASGLFGLGVSTPGLMAQIFAAAASA